MTALNRVRLPAAWLLGVVPSLCGCGDRASPQPIRAASPDVVPAPEISFQRGRYAFDGVTERDALIGNLLSFDEEDHYARVALFRVEDAGREPVRVAHGHTMRMVAAPGKRGGLFLEVVVPSECVGSSPATALFETIGWDGKVRMSRRAELPSR
jgi:hypothetical protein